MEKENFLYKGGKFLPDILANAQLCPDSGMVLESRMSTALAPHTYSYFSASLCFALPGSSSAASPGWKGKQAPACPSAPMPPTVGVCQVEHLPCPLG